MTKSSLLISSVLIILTTSLSLSSPQRSANVLNRDGKPVGRALIQETKQGVKISLDLKGVRTGTHAMHIHQVGSCTGPHFESAGGHYNPTNREHGIHNPEGAHLGDLPNIQVPSNGVLKKEISVTGVYLNPKSPRSLAGEMGSALVIHAKPDDMVSQPAGEAGDRIYCAVLSEPTREASETTN